jgi:RNA polymerase sigma-70 factor (ECF subfamily)
MVCVGVIMGCMVDSGGSGAGLSVGPGDSDDRLGDFFDAALAEVYPYLIRRCAFDRATAEDLTQDTFVTAVRTLRRGRVERLTVGWLITCAQSRFIDHCRQEQRRQRHLRSVPSPEPELVDEGVLDRMVVTEHLAELPANQRLVVVLHHLDGLTVPEVAERIGRSVRAVESLLSRARRTIRANGVGESDDE